MFLNQNLNNLKLKQILGIMFIVALTAVTSSCVILKSATEKNTDNLNKRVHAAWKARVNGDCKPLYDLAYKAYQDKFSLQQHIQRCRLKAESYKIADIKISPDGLTAKATIIFSTYQMGYFIKDTQMMEDWIVEKGHWRLKLPLGNKTPFGKK